MKTCRGLILIIILVFAPFARADIANAKRAEIERLLQLTGVTKLVEQMKAQTLGSIRQSHPQAPAEFWDKFSAQADTHQLLEKMVPIYDRAFTIEDLQALNAFYSSPVGRKLLTVLPNVMQESMRAGREWGGELAREAAHEIQAGAPDKK